VRALIAESNRLYERIGRLDSDLFRLRGSGDIPGDAAAQQAALSKAFGG